MSNFLKKMQLSPAGVAIYEAAFGFFLLGMAFGRNNFCIYFWVMLLAATVLVLYGLILLIRLKSFEFSYSKFLGYFNFFMAAIIIALLAASIWEQNILALNYGLIKVASWAISALLFAFLGYKSLTTKPTNNS